MGIQIHVHFHSRTCRESNGLNWHMDVHAQRFTCWKRFVTSHECPSVCAYGIMSAYEGVNPDREGRYTHTSINVPPCTCMNVLDHKLSRWTHVFWSEHTLMCVFTPENVQMDAICAVTSIPTQPCSSTCLYTTIDMS